MPQADAQNITALHLSNARKGGVLVCEQFADVIEADTKAMREAVDTLEHMPLCGVLNVSRPAVCDCNQSDAEGLLLARLAGREGIGE